MVEATLGQLEAGGRLPACDAARGMAAPPASNARRFASSSNTDEHLAQDRPAQSRGRDRTHEPGGLNAMVDALTTRAAALRAWLDAYLEIVRDDPDGTISVEVGLPR